MGGISGWLSDTRNNLANMNKRQMIMQFISLGADERGRGRRWLTASSFLLYKVPGFRLHRLCLCLVPLKGGDTAE